MAFLHHLISFFSAYNPCRLLFPPFCRCCNIALQEYTPLCSSCFLSISRVATKYYPITKKYKLAVISASDYHDPVRSIILRKFQSDRLASMQLAQIMLKLGDVQLLNGEVFIPIPLHWQRYAWRGFNQAQVIARVLGSSLNIPIISLVKRVKKTPFQSSLTLDGRKTNVQGVFALDDRLVKKYAHLVTGKHIILVDDLCTTGATLIHVAKTLLPLKPAKISAIVAARSC